MKFFPFRRAIYMLPMATEEAIFLLKENTIKRDRPQSTFFRSYSTGQGYIFQGMVYKNRFKISRFTTMAQYFIPLIEGEMANTTNGSVLTIEYKLFHGSHVLFLLWTILSFLVGLFFVFIQVDLTIGISALCLCGLNYLVGLGNFNMHIRDANDQIEKLFRCKVSGKF